MGGEETSVSDDPNRVYKTQVVKAGWVDQFKEMIIQKGFSTTLLCLVVYILYTDTKAEIPNHIKAINDGFQAVSDADREARQQDTVRHLEAVRICIAGQEDEREKARAAADQLERILTNKMGLVVKKVEENEKKIEAFRDN